MTERTPNIPNEHVRSNVVFYLGTIKSKVRQLDAVIAQGCNPRDLAYLSGFIMAQLETIEKVLDR